jgi:hypothetical protein
MAAEVQAIIDKEPKVEGKYYTAFCHCESGEGTIWIETIGPFTAGTSIDDIKMEARQLCASAWGLYTEDTENDEFPVPDISTVLCMGLAEGAVNIINWDDSHLE